MIDFIAIPEERIKILKSDKSLLEKFKKLSDVKISLGEEVTVEGDEPIAVMRAKEVMKAFGRGFEFDIALNLLDEDYVLETIELKHFSGKSRDRQIVLKGRVIGTKGMVKSNIEKYTETNIAIYGKTISIVGKWKNVQMAKEAVEMLLSGSMHTTVYRFLEGRKGA